MISDNYIKIKTRGCRKLPIFEKLGYDISGDYITLKVEHLNKGSRELVDVVCDFCNKEVKIYYKEYLRNISIGNKYSCSKKCGSYKAKETNIKNIGFESHMILKETQEKAKKTNLERYGVEYLQKSDVIREKTRQTCLQKYGVEHISQTDTFKQKYKNSCLEKYGTELYLSSDDFKDKSKKTLYENYGVDNPSKSKIIQDKIKDSNFKKYGTEFYLSSDDFKYKNLKILNDKWDSSNIMKSDIFRENKYSISSDTNYVKYINNSISLLMCDKGHNFEIHIDNYLKRKNSNLPLCTICCPIGDSKSIKEDELLRYIKSIYFGEIIPSYRDGLEIDIYLPELKIGFEFNGLYWHSNKFKENSYHLDKTNYFKERGIRIIHIWEDDYDNLFEIIKSQIRNLLKTNTVKIFARKCSIRMVEVKDSKKFLEDNHIQGSVSSSIKIGLYFKDELVSIMTFDHFEGRKRMLEGEYNLNRFCNKINTNIIGGASKLLSFFIKSYYVKRIISYADKDWSVGDLYYKLGFDNIGGNGPDYKYIIGNKRVHKSRYKKSKLNTDLTESKQMELNGINKIYDCGKIKFEKYL